MNSHIGEVEQARGPLQLSLFGSQADPGELTKGLRPGSILAKVLDDLDEPEGAVEMMPSIIGGAGGAGGDGGGGERPWSERELEAWAPPDNSLVSDWAVQHRILSPDFSAFPGQWEHKGHYAIEIMDAFIDPIVERITLLAAAQSMKTDAVYNMLGYAIQNDPAPALVVMPTLLTLGRVNDRIKSMIEESPGLAKHLTGNDDHMTLKRFKLDNMNIYFATAGSSSDLRNVLARYIIMDEVDDYPETSDKGKQGSPIGQAEERGTTFWNRKIVKLCTPTTEYGYIHEDFLRSDQRRYWVPCPHCLGYQKLSFSRIKHAGCKLGEWPKDKRGEDYILENSVARYECEHCGVEIEEKHKPWMDRMGTWVPEGHPIEPDGSVAIPVPRTRHRGYQWSAIISPFVSWSQLAAEFFKVKDNPDDLRNFINLKLGEIYQEGVARREAEEIMVLRTERPALIAPPGTVALTAGVDNQKHGKWVAIRAWIRDGRSIESHLIRHGFVESFEELEQWIFQDLYAVEGSTGLMLPIWRGGIDIGGSDIGDFSDETMTEEVYGWLRAKGAGVMFGVKGSSRSLGGGKKMRSSIIDRMPGRNGKQGRPIPGGLKLWLLDTALIKNSIWSRIESGKFYLHADIDSTYAKHLTAEQKEKNSRGQSVWTVKGHRANHLFDAEVYAAAMADPECDGGVLVLRPPSGKPSQEERRDAAGSSFLKPSRENWLGR